MTIDALQAPADAAQSSPAGVLVLGMHRSGTSATTRVLNLMGLPISLRSDLMRSRAGNERGHWESESLALYNEAMLTGWRSAWWCPPAEDELARHLEAETSQPRAEALFRAGHRTTQWVWKDPRLCLLAPYWRAALPEPLSAVLVLRPPMEVAHSLLSRNKMQLSWGVALWERYTRQALQGLVGMRVQVIRYSDLLADPVVVMSQLEEFLAAAGIEVIPHGTSAVQAFLTDTLRHQRTQDEPDPMTAPMQDLVDQLNDLVGSHEHFAPAELPAESARTQEVLEQLRRRWREPNPTSTNRKERTMTQQSERLPVEWRRWLAQHRLARTPNETLLSLMQTKAGLTEQDASAELADLVSDPRFQAADGQVQRLRKLDSFLEIRQQLLALAPSYAAVERRRGVARGEFLRRYYSTNTPVVLTDLTDDWPARELWSLDYFRSELGEEPVEVMTHRSSDPRYEQNSQAHKATVRFADYLDHVGSTPGSNEMYLVANNHLLEQPAAKRLLEDFDSPTAYLSPETEQGRVFLWLGPAGTITPLHHDVMNVLLVQVHGRKRVLLVDPLRSQKVYNELGVFSQVDAANPDLESHPDFATAEPVEVILEPGDALFIPVGWWHYVAALDQSMSLSFTNFRWKNDFQWVHPDGA